MWRLGVLAWMLLVVHCEKELSPTAALCGSETEFHLSATGDTSTVTLTLAPTEENGICKMHISAPSTHVIYMQLVEGEAPKAPPQKHPPCVMSIFLPDNPRMPVWKGDLCGDTLTEIDLLTADFKLVWNPPERGAATRGRKFVLTAVGQGDVCKKEGQHTCMRIGWDPMMCVADTLLCNGLNNCPKSSTTSDEDEKLCKKSFFAPSSLEQLAVELLKKWGLPELSNNKWLQEKLEQQATASPPKKPFHSSREWPDNVAKSESLTTTSTAAPTRPPKATDSISQVLSKYGPWGYLMLGMLICGTVLMFCGLWECCFRKAKTEVDPPTTQTQPTTVLILNPEEAVPRPPNYDELDRPPSYSILFPNFKAIGSSSEGQRDASSEENNSQLETCEEVTHVQNVVHEVT